MHGAHAFLAALATVLGVAAATTILFQRLGQPVVLGYLIAGLIIGPHVPIPLVADADTVETLSELGVILLMFSVGLELRVRALVRMGPTAGTTALVQCSLMVWLGFLTGRFFGWTSIESLFAGAAIAISSTTIIAKAFDEQKIRGHLRETVVGILVVEDLIGIVLIAVLTAISRGSKLSAGSLAVTVGKLAAFLIGLLVVGVLTVPRAIRAVVRLDRPETTVISAVAICFGVALLAQAFGYSVALGAFIAGSLVAESGEEKKIEHLIQPVRDVFAAIFFVSVGMMIDPAQIARHALAVGVLTGVVVVGKIVSVTLGAFLTGGGVRTSIQAGMSLAQIGEFSFIIAGVGASLGATREFLYPVAVTVSAVTTLLTPWLIRAAAPVAGFVDRRLPQPLQTFVALYGSWLERLREPGNARTTQAGAIRRMAWLASIDGVAIAAIVIGVSRSVKRVAPWLQQSLHLSRDVARIAVLLVAAALVLPFLVGIMRMARRLGVTLASIAFPRGDSGGVDLAAAPRRALEVTMQVAGMLVIGAPILAVTQPFLRGIETAAPLGVLGALLGIAFWRSATNLQGHVRAGVQVIVDALEKRLPDENASATGTPEVPPDFDRLLPGLGAPLPVRLDEGSPAVGRTLTQLNLRAITGATVLAIVRQGQGLVPTPDNALEVGDVLALAGTHEALHSARQILGGAEAGASDGGSAAR